MMLLRRILLVVLPLLTATPTPLTSPPPPQTDSVAWEGRIRKLHLVRPDLIRYPVYQVVIC